jgi:hypothetical protein
MASEAVYKADPKAVARLAVVFAGPALVMGFSLVIHPSKEAAVTLAALMLLPIGAIAYVASFPRDIHR